MWFFLPTGSRRAGCAPEESLKFDPIQQVAAKLVSVPEVELRLDLPLSWMQDAALPCY